MINYDQIWAHVDRCGWCGLVATGRAGSDALQSQLDSHPEIFNFNGILFFHEFWQNAKSTVCSEYLDIEDITQEFIGSHIDKFRSKYDVVERKDRLGESMDQSISIDIPAFKGHMAALFKNRAVTRKNVLSAVYVSYALALGQDPMIKKVFFHHIHDISRLDPYFEDFPQSKMIATTRDPRAAYVSKMEQVLREAKLIDEPSLPRLALKRLIDDPAPLFALADRFRVMRMEDLSNESVLRSLCCWLGVEFHPCVMKSTWAGLRWWGDNLSPVQGEPGMDEREFTSRIRSNNWQQKLLGTEKFVLDFILKNRLDHCGFDRKHRPLFIHGALSFFAIPLPTTYELRFVSPVYLFNCLSRGKFHAVIAAGYAYIRRVRYYYGLFFRVLAGDPLTLPYFREID